MIYRTLDLFTYCDLTRITSFAVIFVLLTACGSDDPGTNPTNPTNSTPDLAQARQDIAIEVSDRYIIPYYQDLLQKSNAFLGAIETFNQSITQKNLNMVRSEHKELWLSWQKTSLFLFGPAESNSIHSAINSYPANVDTVEHNIVSGIYDLTLISRRSSTGLPAIDYLINNSPQGDDVLLDAFSSQSHRMKYLTDVSDFTTDIFSQVTSDWQTEPFLETFKSTASNGTDVGSALGLLANSLDLHVQQFLRNGKVGIPAGVLSAGIPRPQNTEAFYGGYSNELISESLKTYSDLFNGNISRTGAESLNSYLVKINQSELAGLISQKINEAVAHVSTLNNPLSQQIEDDVQPVLDLFMLLQELAVFIKSDLSSVLGVSITNQDNDGD